MLMYYYFRVFRHFILFFFQDESHSMKSMKTNRTSAALSLIKKAKRCILLSGTPALSRPVELYPQMKAIEPHFMSL